MRDATRGGVASSSTSWPGLGRGDARARGATSRSTPAVAGAAEILGIDPMYVANEGKLVRLRRARGGGRRRSPRCAACPGASARRDRRGRRPSRRDGAGADGVRRQAGHGPARGRLRCPRIC
jgi:hypothetical protein